MKYTIIIDRREKRFCVIDTETLRHLMKWLMAMI